MNERTATDARAADGLREGLGAGDLLVRNYDDRSHHVAVRAYDEGGAIALEAGVHLAGGTAAARPVDLEAGTYTVEADCDGHEYDPFADDHDLPAGDGGRYVVTTCEVSESDALLVAVGNGVVDVAPAVPRR